MIIRPFGWNEFLLLLQSVQWTLLLTVIAFAGGAIGGALVALARIGRFRMLRLLASWFVVIFQGTPLLLQLFLVFFGASVFGLTISPWTAAAIGLTLHASAYLGEIWRGCIESVARGQWEAARALGLTWWSLLGNVILPQAVRVALPPTAGFLVQLIKATSVTSIIGFVELTRTGQIVNNATFSPFLVFSIVAVIYFLLCWPLSRFSMRLEQRFAIGGR